MRASRSGRTRGRIRTWRGSRGRRAVRARARESLGGAAGEHPFRTVGERVRYPVVRPVTRRLRIVHVVHKLDYGGLERLVGALVERLPSDRFESHIVTLSDFGRFADGLAAHARLHQDRSVPHLSMIWPRRLTRTIGALAPDVVHTHSGVWD